MNDWDGTANRREDITGHMEEEADLRSMEAGHRKEGSQSAGKIHGGKACESSGKIHGGKGSQSMGKAVLVWALLCAVLVFLDQYTKYLAVTFLKPRGSVSLIPGVLELRYLENRGAAFGILQNRQWVFVIFAVVCLILCAWISFRFAVDGRHKGSQICLAILAAGAAGNLADRASRGYVVDFIYFSLIRFPVFNLADVCVSAGTIVLIVLVLFVYRE